MTATAIYTRGWCELDDCPEGVALRDVTDFGSVKVCSRCLVRCGGGIEPDELARAEERIKNLEGEVEGRDLQIETLQRRLAERIVVSLEKEDS